MIKLHYPKLLLDDPCWQQRAEMLAARCYELTTFLDEVAGIDMRGVHFDHAITYHDSCSGLRELGIKLQPRRLLAKVTGLSISEMQDGEVCCGFGGTFCVKYPELSGRMVDDKVNHIEQSRADVVLGGDLGCLFNIAGRLQRCGKAVRVYHVAEVLAGMAGQAIGESDDEA
jgi:L-lactate dehydrogenase complex protein LldE